MWKRAIHSIQHRGPAGDAAGSYACLIRWPTIPKWTRTALALAVVVVATFAAAVAGLAGFGQEKSLSVGTISLSVEPGHRGALDLYVPLVDWGARFPAVRLPARLKAEVGAVDRTAVARLAQGEGFDVRAVRDEASDAIAAYIRALVAVVLAVSLAVGLLAAFAVRARTGPRLRVTVPAALGSAVVAAVGVALLLPPRGEISDPQYYAHGPDIPRALEVIEDATSSSEVLDEELNAQLVGLARLVEAPSGRRPLAPLPRLTVASDLHNNILAFPALERAAERGPLLFPGDLTDSGAPFEAQLVRRVVRAGRPLVFVAGNHDSDVLLRQLARRGALVLTEEGRLEPDGGYGPVVAEVAGLRVAGYSDPFMRLRRNRFRASGSPDPTPQHINAFSDWLRPLVGRVDVVLVHSPALAQRAIEELRDSPPDRELTLVVGHTHEPSLARYDNLTVVNGGTIGAGGPTNFGDDSDLGLARLTYSVEPGYAPLAADVVEIDPSSGSATAERHRLDAPG
jgi:predicted phosphodiesterase